MTRAGKGVEEEGDWAEEQEEKKGGFDKEGSEDENWTPLQGMN